MTNTFKLILLGTGGPRLTPVPPRGGSGQLIIAGDDCILVDCGPGTTLNMVRTGIRPNRPHYLLFTHVHHYDHNADYAAFIFENWIWGFEDNVYQPLKVYGPKGTKNFHHRIIDIAYKDEIKLRMGYGEYHAPIVDITEIDGGCVEKDKTWTITSTKVSHGPNALAYRIDNNDKSIVISGDLSRLYDLVDFARGADIFVIDVMHPSAEDIGKTAAEAGIKTLILSHIVYSWFGNKLDLPQKTAEIKQWFKGKIIEARDLMTFEL
jgi:ribonuclease BN (tRNA processing enzyme)